MQHLYAPRMCCKQRTYSTSKSFRCNTYTKHGGGSNRPEDVELFLDVGEIFVARGEGGFALEGEGGGETVGVREFVLGAEFGGGMRQVEIGVHDFERDLGDVLDGFAGHAWAFGAPSGVVH